MKDFKPSFTFAMSPKISEEDATTLCIRKFYLMIINVSLNMEKNETLLLRLVDIPPEHVE